MWLGREGRKEEESDLSNQQINRLLEEEEEEAHATRHWDGFFFHFWFVEYIIMEGCMYVCSAVLAITYIHTFTFPPSTFCLLTYGALK